jgi:hypothetical protein
MDRTNGLHPYLGLHGDALHEPEEDRDEDARAPVRKAQLVAHVARRPRHADGVALARPAEGQEHELSLGIPIGKSFAI